MNNQSQNQNLPLLPLLKQENGKLIHVTTASEDESHTDFAYVTRCAGMGILSDMVMWGWLTQEEADDPSNISDTLYVDADTGITEERPASVEQLIDKLVAEGERNTRIEEALAKQQVLEEMRNREKSVKEAWAPWIAWIAKHIPEGFVPYIKHKDVTEPAWYRSRTYSWEQSDLWLELPGCTQIRWNLQLSGTTPDKAELKGWIVENPVSVVQEDEGNFLTNMALEDAKDIAQAVMLAKSFYPQWQLLKEEARIKENTYKLRQGQGKAPEPKELTALEAAKGALRSGKFEAATVCALVSIAESLEEINRIGVTTFNNQC